MGLAAAGVFHRLTPMLARVPLASCLPRPQDPFLLSRAAVERLIGRRPTGDRIVDRLLIDAEQRRVLRQMPVVLGHAHRPRERVARDPGVEESRVVENASEPRLTAAFYPFPLLLLSQEPFQEPPRFVLMPRVSIDRHSLAADLHEAA